MDLREIYQELGGDYDVMLSRVMRDTLILSLMSDFLEDEEFSKLSKAMDDQDYTAAFNAAHALKGITLNMEFRNLSDVVVPLTEALRRGDSQSAASLFQEAKARYSETIQIIQRNVRS